MPEISRPHHIESRQRTIGIGIHNYLALVDASGQTLREIHGWGEGDKLHTEGRLVTYVVDRTTNNVYSGGKQLQREDKNDTLGKITTRIGEKSVTLPILDENGSVTETWSKLEDVAARLEVVDYYYAPPENAPNGKFNSNSTHATLLEAVGYDPERYQPDVFWADARVPGDDLRVPIGPDNGEVTNDDGPPPLPDPDFAINTSFADPTLGAKNLEFDIESFRYPMVADKAVDPLRRDFEKVLGGLRNPVDRAIVDWIGKGLTSRTDTANRIARHLEDTDADSERRSWGGELDLRGTTPAPGKDNYAFNTSLVEGIAKESVARDMEDLSPDLSDLSTVGDETGDDDEDIRGSGQTGLGNDARSTGQKIGSRGTPMEEWKLGKLERSIYPSVPVSAVSPSFRQAWVEKYYAETPYPPAPDDGSGLGQDDGPDRLGSGGSEDQDVAYPDDPGGLSPLEEEPEPEIPAWFDDWPM